MNSNIKLYYILAILSLSFTYTLNAQVSKNSTLFKTLKTNDSLLFQVGFNTCDFNQFDTFLAEDLEFYHDKSGTTNSKQAFMDVMKTGICKPKNKHIAKRELVQGSLKVFPLYNNNTLYGAIQNGKHKFSESQNGKNRQEGSTARFSHLWLRENNKWVIKRIFSFDHKNPKMGQKISVSHEIMNRYAGSYLAPQTGLVKIIKTEEGLKIDAGKLKAPIHAKSKNIFFHKQAPLTFEFVSTEKGKTQKMIVRENGKIVEEAIKQ